VLQGLLENICCIKQKLGILSKRAKARITKAPTKRSATHLWGFIFESIQAAVTATHNGDGRDVSLNNRFFVAKDKNAIR
jgi:hypothetical protein